MVDRQRSQRAGAGLRKSPVTETQAGASERGDGVQIFPAIKVEDVWPFASHDREWPIRQMRYGIGLRMEV